MLRRIAPTLGLVALLAPLASAQDIAKGVSLSGWVDTTATAETNTASGITGPVKDGGTYSMFNVTGDVKVGWKANEQVSAVVDLHSGSTQGSAFVLQQAYITLAPTEMITVNAGTSYGPFGYYAPEPAGGFAVTAPLSAAYGNNPTGVWATLTPSDKFNATVVVANSIVGTDPNGNGGSNRQGIGGFGLDLVFMPAEEVMLNLEGAIDVTGGGVDTTTADNTSLGSSSYLDANAQFKKDAITVAGEVWYKTWAKTQNNGAADMSDYDDTKQFALMGLVNYALPGTPIPASVTGMASYLSTSQDVSGSSEDKKDLKLTAAVLTNPLSTDSFGLNFEVSYLSTTPADSTVDSESAMLFALEGLVVLK